VVDKPSGLLSIAAGAERERTAYWILSESLRKRGEKRRVAVVHRLDRDTSGLLVFAKDERTKRALMEGWNEAVIERRYVALVDISQAAPGTFDAGGGRIDAPLGEDRGGRVIVVPGGLPAATRWTVIGRGGRYLLLALDLETGRRNQIRAHLAYLRAPVAGDRKYDAPSDPVGRLALHAQTLAFRHPADGRVLRFEAPAPSSFSEALHTTKGKERPLAKAKEGTQGQRNVGKGKKGFEPQDRPRRSGKANPSRGR